MIEILIGMVAAGKSTYSRKRAKEGALIINDDSIVMGYHANQYGLYNKKFKPAYKRIMVNGIMDAVMLDTDVVIDSTNFSKATRQRYVGLAKMLDTDIVAVVFPKEAPEVHGKRRFDSDSRGISLERWCDIATFHDAHYEEPSKDEGFKEIRYINFDDIRS